MQVYLHLYHLLMRWCKYIDAGSYNFLENSSHMNICWCFAEDAYAQAEINFQKHLRVLFQSGRCEDAGGDQLLIVERPTSSKVFSIFFSGGTRRGLTSMKRNPLARNVDRQELLWNCNVGLHWANPFPRNASQSPKAMVKLPFYICFLNTCSA